MHLSFSSSWRAFLANSSPALQTRFLAVPHPIPRPTLPRTNPLPIFFLPSNSPTSKFFFLSQTLQPLPRPTLSNTQTTTTSSIPSAFLPSLTTNLPSHRKDGCTITSEYQTLGVLSCPNPASTPVFPIFNFPQSRVRSFSQTALFDASPALNASISSFAQNSFLANPFPFPHPPSSVLPHPTPHPLSTYLHRPRQITTGSTG